MPELAREAGRMEEGLTYYEHSHRLSARSWSRANLIVGLCATIAGAASAVVQVAGHEGNAGTLFAAAAAGFAGALTFLSPGDRAEAHRLAEREANRLRLTVRRFRNLELDIRYRSDAVAALDALERIAQERDRVLSAMPTVSQRKFRQARTQIQRGIFEYDASGSSETTAETANE